MEANKEGNDFFDWPQILIQLKISKGSQGFILIDFLCKEDNLNICHNPLEAIANLVLFWIFGMKDIWGYFQGCESRPPRTLIFP